MAHVYAVDGLRPVVDPSAFVHPTAVLIGDVIVGPGCYVGPGASLRGDFGRLVLEAGANLQDNCVMHGFPSRDCVVEVNGHVGHGADPARLPGRPRRADRHERGDHGRRPDRGGRLCRRARLREGGLRGPAAHPGRRHPARIMRQLSDDEIAWKSEGTAEYQELTRRCLRSLRAVEPLSQPEPDRPRLNVSGYLPLSATRSG